MKFVGDRLPSLCLGGWGSGNRWAFPLSVVFETVDKFCWRRLRLLRFRFFYGMLISFFSSKISSDFASSESIPLSDLMLNVDAVIFSEQPSPETEC